MSTDKTEVVVGEGILTVIHDNGIDDFALVTLTPDEAADLIARLQCGLREIHLANYRKDHGCTHPADEPCTGPRNA